MVFALLCGARKRKTAPKIRYTVEGKIIRIGSMSDKYKISIARPVETTYMEIWTNIVNITRLKNQENILK